MKGKILKINYYCSHFFGHDIFMRFLLTCIFVLLFYNLQAQDVLGALKTQVETQGNTVLIIIKYICWIFLGLGVVGIIYSAVVDSQRMKLSIISFVAAALVLAVGYGAGLFVINTGSGS